MEKNKGTARAHKMDLAEYLSISLLNQDKEEHEEKP
jgi:hypothetical protein